MSAPPHWSFQVFRVQEPLHPASERDADLAQLVLWILTEIHRPQMAERGIGFVGDITSIQSGLIKTLVESGYIPVVASVAADADGQALNVNADIAAGEVSPPCLHSKAVLLQAWLLSAHRAKL